MLYLVTVATLFSAVNAALDRNDALIGYSEIHHRHTRCQDKHNKCKEWQQAAQCLANPYYMRKACPDACQVPACFGYKPDLQAWKGHATDYHTCQYQTRLLSIQHTKAEQHFRRDASMGDMLPGHTQRGDPWLTLSSLGIGTYLGDEDDNTDEMVASATILSVQGGWNVIDTASNYRSGRGEKAVGYALTALHELKGFTREMIFVSTKAGFLQDSIKQQLLSRKEISSTDIAGGMHCIHPSCLQRSLAVSLQHLRLDTVDLLYLHNPAEMQLSALGTDTFMQRLEQAFRWAEDLRKKGLIRAYGMATWGCFRSAPGSEGYLSLLSVVQLAQRVGGTDHGFRYIQVPVNAAMPEAWTKPWQPITASHEEPLTTLMEAAGQLGVGVFGSGPLQEAALLQRPAMQKKLTSVPELSNVDGTAPKLLQIARSTPGLVASLVGHKTKEHVLANIALSNRQPLTEQELLSAVTALAL